MLPVFLDTANEVQTLLKRHALLLGNMLLLTLILVCTVSQFSLDAVDLCVSSCMLVYTVFCQRKVFNSLPTEIASCLQLELE